MKKSNLKRKLPDLWEVLEKRGVQINRYKTTEHNLTQGRHYYELEDRNSRSIICTRCAIPHGYKLEAHELHEYDLRDGVLYWKGEPINEV